MLFVVGWGLRDMFGSKCCAITMQGEPGVGVKGEKGDHGAPGYKVSDIFASSIVN